MSIPPSCPSARPRPPVCGFLRAALCALALVTLMFGLAAPASAQAQALAPSKPETPTLEVANNKLLVSWTAPADNGFSIIDYDVQYKRSSANPWTEWESSATSTTPSTIISGLTNGRSYDVQVRAANSVGNGAWSDTASATPARAPSRPKVPKLAPGDQKIKVSWVAPANNGGAPITDYDVQYRAGTSGNFRLWQPLVTSTTLSATLTGLTNGTSYDVQVAAQNSGGISNWSRIASAAPTARLPAAPNYLSPDSGDGYVTMSWPKPSVANMAGYQYQIKRSTEGWGVSWTDMPGSGATTTSYKFAELTNFVLYSVRIRAVNLNGESPASPQTSAAPSTPLPAPTGLTATAGDTEVELSWSMPSGAWDSYVTAYEYRKKETSVTAWGAWTLSSGAGTVSSLSTTHTVTGLANGTTYDFQVRAMNISEAGQASVEASATLPARAPSKPDIPTLTVGNGQLTVAWTAPVDNGEAITDYDVQYRAGSSGDFTQWNASADSTTLSATITGLFSGTSYQVQVRATNSVGNSPWSDAASAAPTAVAPSRPRVPTLAPGDGRIRVSWVAPANNGDPIHDYDVQYKLSSDSDWTNFDASSMSTALSATITGLDNGTSYDVQVRAINFEGASQYSSSASATPTDQKPATPSGIRAGVTPPGDGFGHFDWNDPSDPSIIKYQYRKREGQSGAWSGWAEMPGSGATTKSYRFTGLTNFVNNYIDIRAVNLNGESSGSSDSGSASVFPRHPLPAPTGLTAAPGNQEVELSWSMPSGAWDSSVTAYQYQKKEGSGDWGAWTQGSSSRSTTKHTVTGLTNGTTYSFQVRAMSLSLPGLASGEASATLPALAPSKPETPTLEVANNKLLVSWTAPADNGFSIIDYDVQYKRSSANPWTEWESSATSTTPSTIISGLTNGRSYDVQVRAANSVGNGAWSDTASATPARAPSRPKVPKLAPGDQKIKVSWVAPANNGGAPITDYDVQYRAGTSGNFRLWQPLVTSTTLSATLTGLTNGTSYDVQVAAQNSGGISNWSRIASAAPTARLPAAPNYLSPDSGDGYVTMSWPKPSVANMAGYQYQIKRSTEGWGVSWTDMPGSGATTTSYKFAELTNFVLYSVRIRAVNLNGESPASPQTSAAPSTPLPAPTGLTATAGDTEVELSWSMPSGAWDSYVTAYEYRKKETSVTAWGAWTLSSGAGTVSSLSTTHTVTGLANGTTYDFQVRAMNISEAGQASVEASATLPARAPSKPDIPTLTVGNGQLTVAWTAPVDNGEAITDYDVQYRAGSSGDFTQWNASADSTTLSATITGLFSGTSYQVQVRATNSVGNSPWSDAASAAPTAVAPSRPRVPTLAPGDGRIRVSWVAPANNGDPIHDYDVQYKLSSDSDWTNFDASSMSTALSATITGLDNGTSYDVQVRAINFEGASQYSSSASATPTDQKPATPSGIRAGVTPPGDGFGHFDWNDPSDPSIIKYQYRKREGQSGAWSGWAEMPGSGATTKSYRFTGLTNFVNNYIDIRAVNLNGESSGSSDSGSASVFPRHPLPAPTGLTAAPGNQEVELSWSMPSGAWDSSVTAYQYQKKEGSGDWGAWTQGSSSRSTTKHTVTGLTNGTTYSFQVRAMSLSLPGLASGEASATLPALAPSKPETPTLEVANNKLLVSWTAPADNGFSIIDYDVQYKRSSANPWTEWESSATSTTPSTIISGLTNGRSYDVQVRAANSVGNGAWSDTASATPARAPSRPKVPKLAPGDQKIKVSWVAPANNGGAPITDYDVQYRAGTSGNFRLWQPLVTSTTLSATLTGLTNGTSYDVQVAAQNSGGISNWSRIASAAPTARLPAAPNYLSPDSGDGYVTMSWPKPSVANMAGYQYQIKRSTEGWGVSWTDMPGSGATTTSYKFAELTNFVLYSVRIRAVNLNGESPASPQTSAAPSTPLPAPTGLTGRRATQKSS